MKLILKKTPENVISYNRSTNGYEFIGSVDNIDQFHEKIATLEGDEMFAYEDGHMTDCSGNEVFDPAHPDMYEFNDYTYSVVETNTIDHYNDAAVIRAIEKANPWNLDEIMELINP